MITHSFKIRLLAIGIVLLLSAIGERNAAAQQIAQTSAQPTTSTSLLAPVMLPWLSLDTTRPLVLHLKHDIQYDPKALQLTIRSSQWSVDRLKLAFFGGRAGMSGSGTIDAAKKAGASLDSDVATTVTLEAVDVQRFLKFLQLPHSDEIEGRVTGFVHVRIVKGDWAAFEVHMATEPGTVRLSRGLIVQILGGALAPDEIHLRVDPVLDGKYGSSNMIPIDSLKIDGSLGQSQLLMNIPIHNDVLNIDFEPHIDRPLLWQAWQYLMNAGLKDVKSIQLKK